MKLTTVTFTALLFLMPSLALAEKTDIVILKNGDRVTGEIKRLEAGLLEFKTDTMGTINIEWRFISEVISDTGHSVEITDGARVIGTLQKPGDGEHLLVNTVSRPVDLQLERVISVWPVEATFIDRMELDVSFGLDYEKATSITNLDGAIDFRLRGDERLTEASLRTNITRQPQDKDPEGVEPEPQDPVQDDPQRDEQQRYELKGLHEYLLPNQRFRTWFGSIESNDALGVTLRLTGGGAFGKYMIKSSDTWFALSAGLSATQENPTSSGSGNNGDGGSETNLEAVGNIRYRYFRFAEPERSLDTTLSVFPSLTDRGRVRADFRTTFKLELVEDLFWSMELYGTHDSKPLVQGAEQTDYGIITSVGWSY